MTCRQSLPAQYPEPGIISGCEVKGTAAMSYQIAAGAVCVSTSRRGVGCSCAGARAADYDSARPTTRGASRVHLRSQQLTEPVNGSVASKVESARPCRPTRS